MRIFQALVHKPSLRGAKPHKSQTVPCRVLAVSGRKLHRLKAMCVNQALWCFLPLHCFLKVWGLITEWLLFESCSEVLPCHCSHYFQLCGHNFRFFVKPDWNSVVFPPTCSFSAHHLLAHNATYATPTHRPWPPFWFNSRTAQEAPPPPTAPAPFLVVSCNPSSAVRGGAWPTVATNRHPMCGGAAANRLLASSGVRCPCALLCWRRLVAAAAARGAAVAVAAWPRFRCIFTEDEPLWCPARVLPCPSEPIHLATGEGRAATCWCVWREPGWGEGGGWRGRA